MVDQIRRSSRDSGEIFHESPHDMLIFKIKKSLPVLKTRVFSLPKDDGQQKTFAKHFTHFLESHPNISKIDLFYQGIEFALKMQTYKLPQS